jgi:hypothetical protein
VRSWSLRMTCSPAPSVLKLDAGRSCSSSRQ